MNIFKVGKTVVLLSFIFFRRLFHFVCIVFKHLCYTDFFVYSEALLRRLVRKNEDLEYVVAYILLRMVISFYLHYIRYREYICVIRTFYYPHRFLHHLVPKNEGRVYICFSMLTLSKRRECVQSLYRSNEIEKAHKEST